MNPGLKEFLIQDGWDANWSRGPLTSDEMDAFVEYLIQKGFHIEKKTTPLALSNEIRSRYPKLPADYEMFLSRVSSVITPLKDAWFWCEPEFNRQSPANTWRWDDYEVSEMAALDSLADADDRERTKSFWDQHIPIAYCVASDYSYLAISLKANDFGSVVNCFEPYSSADEEEPPDYVCSSFSELTDLLRWGIERGEKEENPREIYDFIE
jgi:hypothetical protein